MFALADCNNFFASCERVFRPELQGKPVIVLSNNDGCAVARSNEAKALGIRMGDPFFKIRDIVEKNDVAVFSGNMALYGDMSQRVRWVLEDFAPAIEVYSIDEAFLDLRGMKDIDFDAYAKKISAECWRLTSIPVSVGIAPSKTLAKIASKLCKQYPKLRGGCYMHRPQDIEKVLRRFPIEDVWGIGRRTAAKLHSMGVRTAWDYTQLPEYSVRKIFALPGLRTWRELRGEPCIEFEDGFEAKQSICVSRSFSREVVEVGELVEQIANFASTMAEKLRRQKSLVSEMAVFAYTNRFKDNEPQTYGNSLVHFPQPVSDQRTIVSGAVAAAQELFRQGYGYKKAGVVATHLIPESDLVHSLFEDTSVAEREQRLTSALDAINGTFGRGAVKLAVQGSGRIKSSSERQSPHYTTLWSDIPKVSVK
ncbi:MAG: Y-family DNA polymerase [Bacteroidales bacterium]|nr:Y-family DNA polymerase [Bacteroidales bacterium]MBR2855863.1 Y-family DNA polymerase [Bacteroidales bacterium]